MGRMVDGWDGWDRIDGTLLVRSSAHPYAPKCSLSLLNQQRPLAYLIAFLIAGLLACRLSCPCPVACPEYITSHPLHLDLLLPSWFPISISLPPPSLAATTNHHHQPPPQSPPSPHHYPPLTLLLPPPPPPHTTQSLRSSHPHSSPPPPPPFSALSTPSTDTLFSTLRYSSHSSWSPARHLHRNPQKPFHSP